MNDKEKALSDLMLTVKNSLKPIISGYKERDSICLEKFSIPILYYRNNLEQKGISIDDLRKAFISEISYFVDFLENKANYVSLIEHSSPNNGFIYTYVFTKDRESLLDMDAEYGDTCLVNNQPISYYRDDYWS